MKTGLTRTVDLDIPKGVESAENYCATLAHKACHSFTYNSVFDSIEHPRYVELSGYSKRSVNLKRTF